MTKTIKDNIITALEQWLKDNEYSANEFAAKSGVPSNYLSYMRRNIYIINSTGKDVEIDDKYFRMICEAIDFDPDNKIAWTPRQTPQLMQMITYLTDAKKFGYTNIIIGDTGTGKTYSTDLFIKENPKDTFKITVGSLDTINDLLDKIGIAMRMPLAGSPSKKLRVIVKEMTKLKLDGRNPMIIWDESEYLKQATLCNIKELHDNLYGKCALIMIGTNQLLTKIEKLKNKNAAGMPQFYRRVKYGIRELKPIDTRFKEFLTSIVDRDLKRFLQAECENYGELHDALLPAMREAERLNEPLTENLVRKVLALPKMTA
ncbi:AAA domain-containing protein [Chryseobacterium sp. 52]|uniref:ATP-binding protein n=1 Tax=Chryseobacterium sp. 52 TaxID=2035213 RepID=UPI000C189597|nr:ATP-binding protein [Chryseobacterium sp. 52]PIF44890.1 AAA domain-containing protein [Chryseobacterium sp. 52]